MTHRTADVGHPIPRRAPVGRIGRTAGFAGDTMRAYLGFLRHIRTNVWAWRWARGRWPNSAYLRTLSEEDVARFLHDTGIEAHANAALAAYEASAAQTDSRAGQPD